MKNANVTLELQHMDCVEQSIPAESKALEVIRCRLMQITDGLAVSSSELNMLADRLFGPEVCSGQTGEEPRPLMSAMQSLAEDVERIGRVASEIAYHNQRLSKLA